MKLILQSLSHGPLRWQKEWPSSFNGWHLPGASLRTAKGEFGIISIQEYHSKYFTIRLSVFDILQHFVTSSQVQGAGLFSRLILKGQSEQQIEDTENYTLHKNMFTLLKGGESIVTDYYTQKQHVFFDTIFTGKLINELAPSLPQVQQWWESSSIITTPHWVDTELMQTIHTIFRCTYEKDLRHYFFKTRVRDLLLNYLLQLNDQHTAEKWPSEKEIQAVYKAEQIISTNIAAHTHIDELAKKVLLNEYALKNVFKIIFGTGPYEYLTRQRMKKAKELLEAGCSIKEAAAQTGYRPSNFTSAFFNFYHVTPGSVKKKSS